VTATPLFDAPAPSLREQIDAELSKPFSRYEPDDVCAGKHQGAPTSEEAHERLRDGKESVRLQILAFLLERGRVGATCEETKDALEMRYTSASARCSELIADGRALRIGATRPTSSGSAASVLVLPEFSR
jgi:hypothetical protein